VTYPFAQFRAISEVWTSELAGRKITRVGGLLGIEPEFHAPNSERKQTAELACLDLNSNSELQFRATKHCLKEFDIKQS
jgi:hypothetical protein